MRLILLCLLVFFGATNSTIAQTGLADLFPMRPVGDNGKVSRITRIDVNGCKIVISRYEPSSDLAEPFLRTVFNLRYLETSPKSVSQGTLVGSARMLHWRVNAEAMAEITTHDLQLNRIAEEKEDLPEGLSNSAKRKMQLRNNRAIAERIFAGEAGPYFAENYTEVFRQFKGVQRYNYLPFHELLLFSEESKTDQLIEAFDRFHQECRVGNS